MLNDFFRLFFPVKNQPVSDIGSVESSGKDSQPLSIVVDERKASPVAVICQSELDYISRCVQDYPNIETGGDLFGFWTNEGVPVVLYAIGPGREANHQQAFFVQDVNYFVKIASFLEDKYQLSHMGEWHSHHQLGLARPSGHDANTIFNGLRNVPLRRMLLCIANYRQGRVSVNPYMFHESDMFHYVDASWRILPVQSPYRTLIDNDLKDVLIHPVALSASLGEFRTLSAPQPKNEVSRLGGEHWMRRKGGVDLLKRMIGIISLSCPEDKVAPQWDEFGNIYIVFGDRTIKFTESFPVDAPVMMTEGQTSGREVPWEFASKGQEDETSAILETFEKWIQTNLNSNNKDYDDSSAIQ